MARLIRADGTESDVQPKGKTFRLQELYALLSCTTVELVTLPGRPRRQLWMDEEGKYTSKPVNERATTLARTAGIAPSDYVVGDVLLTSAGEVA